MALALLNASDWSAVWISVQVAFAAATLTLPFAILVAWFLARSRSRFVWLGETLVNLPLVLPPVVTGFLLLVLFSPNGFIGSLFPIVLTWYAAVLAAIVVGFPLAVRPIQLAFQEVNRELELTARTLGAGCWTSFFQVSLPLARRGIWSGWILAFARSLGEFGATILFAGNILGETRTIPLAIYSHVNSVDGIQHAWPLVAVSVLLSCGALLIGQFIEHRHRSREL